jgi:deazaflavin-dependent oxidoreductase (nitroreductase family)
MKKVIRWPLWIVGTFLIIRGVIALLGGRQAVRNFALTCNLTFNKHVLNPVMLTVAGRAQSPYALLHHVGRRSGHAYATPVVAERSADRFVIALLYGPGSDWYRNVLAAGRCTLTWHGQDYLLGEPELLDARAAEPLLVPWRAFGLKLLGVKHYVRMRCLAEVSEQVAPVA